MTAPLWQMSEVLAATGGEGCGALPAGADGVSIDSRTLEPADLFFAIRDRTDGHAYVEAALGKGAAAAVIARDYKSDAAPLIRVDDPLEALNRLGRAARARSSAKIAAVTGSAGKTSTKEMLRIVLRAAGTTHASEKSYNNLWGVPLSLARMPHTTRFGVFEIGMNHAGEIAPLTQFVRPHIAIVTTIAGAPGVFVWHRRHRRSESRAFWGLSRRRGDHQPRPEHFPLLEQRALFAAADDASARTLPPRSASPP
jgi:UDP-N-acetylmuramoyl-tripeptide--D-alanyl-D-alanine ligase